VACSLTRSDIGAGAGRYSPGVIVNKLVDKTKKFNQSFNNFLPKPSNLKTMKKIIYTLLFAFVTSMAISSCTEEEVKPKQESGGVPSDPKQA
jgi:hypothetical protein